MNIEMETTRRGAFICILLINIQILQSLFPFPLLVFIIDSSFFSKLLETFEELVYFALSVQFFSPIGLVNSQASISKLTSSP